MDVCASHIPPFELVIFDFDGTLAASYPWFLLIFDEFANRYHLPMLDKPALEAQHKMDITHISREYKISLVKMARMGAHLKQKMVNQIENVSLEDGMAAVVEHLRRMGVKMAVASSNAEENARQALGRLYAPHFEAFECGVSLLGKKGKFEKILRSMGISAENTLNLGDEVRDLKASRQAGLIFGAVTWDYADGDILRALQPDFLFDHPREIFSLVSR